MRIKEKESTIKVKESTKKKLTNLNFVKKGMTYNDIILKLVNKRKRRGK